MRILRHRTCTLRLVQLPVLRLHHINRISRHRQTVGLNTSLRRTRRIRTLRTQHSTTQYTTSFQSSRNRFIASVRTGAPHNSFASRRTGLTQLRVIRAALSSVLHGSQRLTFLHQVSTTSLSQLRQTFVKRRTFRFNRQRNDNSFKILRHNNHGQPPIISQISTSSNHIQRRTRSPQTRFTLRAIRRQRRRSRHRRARNRTSRQNRQSRKGGTVTTLNTNVTHTSRSQWQSRRSLKRHVGVGSPANFSTTSNFNRSSKHRTAFLRVRSTVRLTDRIRIIDRRRRHNTRQNTRFRRRVLGTLHNIQIRITNQLIRRR